MKRVAVFGNAGGGKSTLARRLAELTRLPLHVVGWPEGSPVISSSLSSYQVLWLCHRHLTPKYRALVSEVKSTKRVHHLRSAQEMSDLLGHVRLERETR